MKGNHAWLREISLRCFFARTKYRLKVSEISLYWSFVRTKSLRDISDLLFWCDGHPMPYITEISAILTHEQSPIFDEFRLHNFCTVLYNWSAWYLCSYWRALQSNSQNREHLKYIYVWNVYFVVSITNHGRDLQPQKHEFPSVKEQAVHVL